MSQSTHPPAFCPATASVIETAATSLEGYNAGYTIAGFSSVARRVRGPLPSLACCADRRAAGPADLELACRRTCRKILLIAGLVELAYKARLEDFIYVALGI